MTVTITFSNIQSVGNKENELLEYLTNNNFDACIPTETCLKDTDKHVVWVNCSSLNTNSYRIITSNRPNRPEGGLTLAYKSSLLVKTLEEGVKKSFKYAVWSLKTNSTSLAIITYLQTPIFNDESSQFINIYL